MDHMDHDSLLVTMTIFHISRYKEPKCPVTEIYILRTHNCSGMYFITEKQEHRDYMDPGGYMVTMTIYYPLHAQSQNSLC